MSFSGLVLGMRWLHLGQRFLGLRRHNRSLSGSKRDWSGLPAMPSIPDDKDLPSPGRRRSLGSLLAGRMDAERSLSPKVEELDELGERLGPRRHCRWVHHWHLHEPAAPQC